MSIRVRDSLAGGQMIEGRTFGRVWRLWRKPWAWPYAFHKYGLRCFGIGPIGFQMFDRRGAP